MSDRTKAKVVYYGLDKKADIWADQIESEGLEGMRFRLNYAGEKMYVRAPIIGRHSVHNALAAVGAGFALGMTWEEVITGLQQAYTQIRLVAVRSENGALLLDDTYNASPESMLAALNLLEELDGRKIAVLGDMLELGPYEREGHELVGVRAASVAKVLVTLGERAHMIAEAARKAGMKKSAVFEFEDIESVIDWMNKNLTANDAVLLKGSHGLRMDRITAALEVSS